jgi:hypothetical protein
MHGPPGSWIRSLPPFDRVRYPAKWLAWTVFGTAMLSGLGVDSLRFAAATRPRRVRLAEAAALLLGAVVCAVSPQPLPVRLASAAGCGALALLALFAPASKVPRWNGARRGRRGRPGRLARDGLRWAAALCPEEALRRCPTVIEPLAHPGPRSRRWTRCGAGCRDGRFDESLLRRQREALLGYTNLTCRVPTLRTAAPLKTAGAAAIEESVGAAEDALPAAPRARVL